ncbi:hypothetical protein KSD_29120 [Ktedonobacter sp. SOSP1-85]|uniref:LabA-like NYN domain-containing protein n=1 Tax=Ktedonobacter sp. SOSP1-85 TaxID=2778367 RepID=UPI0019153074|nr:NYN domain-containing protein [Ktedonobacter sp. SOSP1-85]GHO75141.1 hypothetical protein KSD_29120 [Ktedonobacter sp. SOSP1-85]
MTTKHSHSDDHNDVDANIVEHPSDPNSTVESTASETATSSEAEAVTGSSFPVVADTVSQEQHVEEEAQQQAEEPTTPVASSSTDTEASLPTSSEVSASVPSPELSTASSAHEQEEATPVAEKAESVADASQKELPTLSETDTNRAEVTQPADAEIPAQEETVEAPRATEEQAQEAPTTPEQEPLPVVGSSEAETPEPQPPTVIEVDVQAIEEKLSPFGQESFASLHPSKEDEVRSFTSFIEEFRQAEAQARFDASLRESQLEAFALLSPLAQRQVERTQTGQEQEESQDMVAGEEATSSTPVAEPERLDETISSPADTQETVPERTTEEVPTSMSESEEKKNVESVKSEEEGAAQPVKERAVSPLLRPASRIRFPRHSARHLRDEREKEKAASNEAEAPVQPEAEAQPEAAPAPAESTPPRPARRYRFDRPSASKAAAAKPAPATSGAPSALNGTTPSAPAMHAEEPKETKETKETPEIRAVEAEAQPEVAPKAAETAAGREGQTSKKANQDSTASETATPPVKENGRRRGHERQKEVTSTMATSPVAPNSDNTPTYTTLAAAVEEIAPEDLPPLEYSELQKAASSRRRRRHRPTTGSTSAPVTPTPLEPTPAPALAQPTAPARGQSNELATPVSSLPQSPSGMAYSIVSGYTINQMNHGGDLPGPFMGPDPSPARGSVVSRDGGRTIARAEVQRTPSYPVSTPGSGRGQEGMPSAAAFNHFTNSIVQALQLQSDRLVTEMRRQAQAPTNVSVTLPPFPSTERVGVFVDVANLLYSARTLRMSVDFGKLLDFLRGNRRLVRAQAYCPTSPQAGDEQMFLQAVKGLGYRITTKNYKTFSSGAKKADLDLDLCMDVVRLVEGRAVDCVVLVSGDSDFMPMLDYCSDHGVRVEVAAFDEAMSATLRQSCDLFVNLSLLEEIRS